jgi:ribosomal protein S19
MAKNESNYNSLDKAPYNSLLQRENDLTFQFGRQTPLSKSTGGVEQPIGAGSNDGTTQTRGGSVATVSLKSEANATDIWIRNYIRSVNWKPKTVGFYIDGHNGYAEFANIFVSGTIVVSAGRIGGFDIGADYIRDQLDTMGMASTDTAGDDIRFWAGDTFANRATAAFRVYESGIVDASDIRISGASSTVDVAVLQGLIAQDNLSLANQTWGQSCSFTSVDHNTVTWGGGEFVSSDGTTDTISAGTTGNIGTKTYIYYNGSTPGAYYVSTDINDTIGATKVVIGLVTPTTPGKKASFQLFGGGGGIVLAGSDLVPGSVGYTELAYPPLNGSGAPTSIPGALGQLYIDTFNLDAYISTGTMTDSDWRKISLTAYVTSRDVSKHEDVSVGEDVGITII